MTPVGGPGPAPPTVLRITLPERGGAAPALSRASSSSSLASSSDSFHTACSSLPRPALAGADMQLAPRSPPPGSPRISEPASPGTPLPGSPGAPGPRSSTSSTSAGTEYHDARSQASVETPPPGLSLQQGLAAVQATAGQRIPTYIASHGLAWLGQAGALATAAALRASPQAMNLASTLAGGAIAAMGKEFIGERMKMLEQLGASIQLPEDTLAQRLAPKVMAGANDMLAAAWGSMANVAIGAALAPALQSVLEKQGLQEATARPVALALTAVAQRLVQTVADSLSDIASTAMKATLYPGAQAGNTVNAKYDMANALGGLAARALINFGLTLPVGVPVALGKILEDGSAAQKTAASNALAWAGMNGWIVAKGALADGIASIAPGLKGGPAAQPPAPQGPDAV
jgi:hypothetical protein